MFGCLHSERVDSQEHAVETRKSHWWCIKIKHRKFTKTQNKTHMIRIWMIPNGGLRWWDTNVVGWKREKSGAIRQLPNVFFQRNMVS